jgi:chain length determinant protein tyrosine kinase EpsG
MLMKKPENVLPIESSGRVLARAPRSIGAILVEEGKLSPADAEQVADKQRKLGLRFGEAALHLNVITDGDLRHALATQFDFSYLQAGPQDVSRELLAAYDPFHRAVEELRTVRTQLLLRWYNPDAGRRTLAIVSPRARDGRSYVAANLAVVFSQLGLRTLLIDADMRAPRQHNLFNIPDRVGLSAALSGRGDHRSAVAVPGIAGLSVLPAGTIPPNPQELLSRMTFASLVKEAQAEFDLVIVDTPPALEFADVHTVAYRTGDALLLARKDQTRIADTVRVARELADNGARVVGSVMNAL